jgi:hypothetical protein
MYIVISVLLILYIVSVLNNVLSLQLSQLLPITAGNTDVPAMDRS